MIRDYGTPEQLDHVLGLDAAGIRAVGTSRAARRDSRTRSPGFTRLAARHARILIGAALLLLVPVAGAAASTQTFTGTVDAFGTALGVHAFTVSSPATVTVDLTWPNSGANLTLFLKNPSGATVASNTSAEKPKRITYQATTTGTWKINVKAASGASSYTATLTLGPPAPPVNQPRYIRTIGNGKGHATIYPSGLDVDPSGNVYIADTGNDQVAAYAPTGTQLWRVGTRGPKAPGVFQNPRDLAYLGLQSCTSRTPSRTACRC